MTLVAASIVPYNPLLTKSIGRENQSLFQHTLTGVETIADHIQTRAVDTVVCISAQAPYMDTSYGINQTSLYQGTFEQFGDLATEVAIRGDVSLAHQIKEYSEGKISIKALHEQHLPYGVSVPVLLLQSESQPFRLITIQLHTDTYDMQYAAGKILGKKIHQSTAKVALVTALHGGHTTPATALSDAKALEKLPIDETLVQAIETRSIEKLAAIPKTDIATYNLLGTEQLALSFGILADMQTQYEILSYERQFGISHITALTR